MRDGWVEAAGEVVGEAGGEAPPRGERHGPRLGGVGWKATLGEEGGGAETAAGGMGCLSHRGL